MENFIFRGYKEQRVNEEDNVRLRKLLMKYLEANFGNRKTKDELNLWTRFSRYLYLEFCREFKYECENIHALSLFILNHFKTDETENPEEEMKTVLRSLPGWIECFKYEKEEIDVLCAFETLKC